VISGLHGAVSAARDETGKLTRTSTLTFTSITGPGFTIGLKDGKFSMTQGTTPPVESDNPLSLAAAALSLQGFPSTFQDAQETPDGIIGEGLQIQATLPAPPAGLPGGFSGETPVTYTIGLLHAEVSYQVQPNAPAAVTPGTGTATTDAAAVPGAVPALPTTDLAGLPGAVPALTGVGTAVPTIDLASLQATRAAVGSDVGWIYLMVAAVGLAAVGGCAVLYRGAR
jgi:hypothetical protein